ncbi:MAG: GH3 auxin-responsive promoter family protein [Candidatus Thiodiazotropha sp.]
MNWSNLSDLATQQSANPCLEGLQFDWLMRCLRHNCNTKYGRQHRFVTISSIADYQMRVPIVDYDDLFPWIEEMTEGIADHLFHGRTVAFERTSGTTSAQKIIPYSAQSLEDFRRGLLPWLTELPQQYGITSGKAYWAISPATRQPQVTAGGIPIGLPDSAYLGDDLTGFFLQVSAVPFWVAKLQDVNEWQLATLYFLLRSADLQLISVWSPTFLSTLIQALSERRQELEQALTEGLYIHPHELPADTSAYRRFQQFHASGDPRTLWPELKLISCWADASSQPYYRQLKTHFGDIPFQPKGLLSTEAVVTVPDHKGRTLLTTQSGFFEFLDSAGNIHLAHELQLNQEYQVILTTAGGLYRYLSGDRVRCRGHVGNLPELRFVGRERTSDLAGEKLNDNFVGSCLEDIEGFRMLLALNDSPGYCLVLETAAATPNIRNRVEQKLCRNPHYDYARKLNQLQPLKLLALDNPTELYLNRVLQRGGRLGDIKLPVLCFETDLFNDYLDRAA